MLQILKNLIFGLNEYEKVRIDDRMNQVYEMSDKVKLSKLEDFELLEECIFKIKEQLRVKSSNLNRTIRDSSNSLTRKKVLKLIENLEEVRYSFLKTVFAKYETEINNETIHEEPVKEETKVEIEPEDIPEVKEELKQEEVKELESIKDVEITEDKDHKVILSNGKIPYLIVEFKNEVNYVSLRDLSSILFDSFETQGTNIIIENNIALIIPRKIDDKLIELPTIKSDTNKVYEQIIKVKNSKEETNESKETEEYIKIDDDSKKQEIYTKKSEEDSLDSLLMGIESKHPKTDKKEEKRKEEKTTKPSEEKPVILEGESIEIEKKEEENKPIEEYKEEKEYEIYKDDKIIVSLNPNSKVLGEVIVEPRSKENLSQINEADLSYLTIFSKIFASVLFETANAQGTNIMWNTNENQMRIVPRYENDNLIPDLVGKQVQTEYLDRIKERLIAEMKKEVKEEKLKEKEPEEVNLSNPNINTNDPKNSDSDSMEERAKYILNCLKRLP